MTSEPQIAANRRNSRRSTGPRTAAGERRASRNSLRHGLAAVTHRPPAPSGDIERLARAICGTDEDPLLFGAAIAIAENHFARRAVQAQQIGVVERLRDITAIALEKGDNSFALAKASFLQAWLANREIEKAVPKLLEKYNLKAASKKIEDGLPFGRDPVPPWLEDLTNLSPVEYWKSDLDDMVPIRLKALLEVAEDQERALSLATKHLKAKERDEFEAVEAAIPDLKRLDRYEKRSWSRQKRAIREFMTITLLRKMDSSHN